MEPNRCWLRHRAMTKKLRVLLVLGVVLGVVSGVLVLVVAVTGALGQWSGEISAGDGAGSTSSTSTSEIGPEGDRQSAERSGQTDDASSASGLRQTTGTTPMSRVIISTGELRVRPESILSAQAETTQLVSSWGGNVAEEQSSSDQTGRLDESRMTLRVPTPKFAAAMTALAELGTVQRQSRASEDATTRVIDNDARVRAAERSIRQIESLIGRATKLGEVIAIESDLARRQADLDSLKSQQAYLADQTTLSTINLHLTSQTHRPEPRQAQGFLAGLEDGWSALVGGAVIVLTGVGALLPFALVLSVLGLPSWWLLRRRLRLRGHPVSPAGSPARSA